MFWVLLLVLILSLRKLRGFLLYGSLGKIFVSLVSFDVLVFDFYTCYSLIKDPNIMLV